MSCGFFVLEDRPCYVSKDRRSYYASSCPPYLPTYCVALARISLGIREFSFVVEIPPLSESRTIERFCNCEKESSNASRTCSWCSSYCAITQPSVDGSAQTCTTFFCWRSRCIISTFAIHDPRTHFRPPRSFDSIASRRSLSQSLSIDETVNAGSSCGWWYEWFGR